MRGYRSHIAAFAAQSLPEDEHFEFADLRRYARLRLRGFVALARSADRPSLRSIIADHLGIPTEELPVVVEQWPAYEHVNVQAAFDSLLAEDGRPHRIVGLSNFRHTEFGLADLLIGPDYDIRPGNPTSVTLPSGPSGAARDCLLAAVVLVEEGADKLALLYRGPDADMGRGSVTVEAVSTGEDSARRFTSALRTRALELNVYRGQVVSFGPDMFGERSSLLKFRERPVMSADELILPSETFADLRRQVVGVARHRDRLRDARQHLKRGLLLYGPPGVGKTHSVRYLLGELVNTTILELTGETLGALREACSIARALQPAMIVVEDVDLIAEERDHYSGETPMLFTLLNEMDGLDDDADVVFLLTTNRPDLLEPALAARPGRVDQAVHIDLPDRSARHRLIELYRGDLDLDVTRIDTVLDQTEGVTASFLKELLRRSAVIAADRETAAADGLPLRVTADDLDLALADLLDTRNQMTRVALGLRDPQNDAAAYDEE